MLIAECQSQQSEHAIRTQCACCARGSLDQADQVVSVYSNVRAFRDEAFPVWRCSHCHSIISQRRADLPHYYAHYPFQKRQLDGWTRRVFNNLLRRLCQAGMKRESHFLDYGCGEGLFIEYLKERGFINVRGFDPFSEHYRCESVLCDRYDFVMAQDVIEHVEDPQATLVSWRKLLAPNGQLYVGTPNATELNLDEVDQDIHSLHQPYHLHIFSEKALKQLASKVGLECQHTYDRSYCDTLWPSVNFTFLQRYLRSLGNTLDAGFEEPQAIHFFRNPSLLFWTFFGWFFPIRTEMSILFKAVQDNG